MKPILALRDLCLVRGTTTILSDVSWRVERGQHWAIVGPNGCGKSSLLRSITGYLAASRGEIELLGQKYGETDWRDLREKIGLVTSALQSSIPPAEPALETVISGRYAQLDLWVKTTSADTRNALKRLRQVSLEYLADRPWLYLSQGERQRVLIARALMAKPLLLILDEPCAGLDPVAREDFLHFVDTLARSERSPTLVLVTHHVEEIMPAFTHALLLSNGRVHAAGPRSETLTNTQLSEIFGRKLRLSRRGGRLSLSVPAMGRYEST